MDGDASRPEGEFAIRIHPMDQNGRHIAVFDHHKLSVFITEMTDLLIGIGFGYHAAGHLGSTKQMKPDKRRIDAVDERIIDLKITDHLDASLFHGVDRPAANQSAKRSAVAVRTHGNAGL